MHILLGNRVIGCFGVEKILFIFVNTLYVTSVGFSIIWYGPFRSGCSFLEITFCVVKLGIKTNVTIFKSVAVVKRELIWVFMFCLCSNFFVIF